MRRESPAEPAKKHKGSFSYERWFNYQVTKYVRILPRPAEVQGQPLSIYSQRQGAHSMIHKIKLTLGLVEWCQPGEPSRTAYNKRSNNIFLRLQDEPIPSTSTFDETFVLPLLQRVGTPDDTPLYSEDSAYLHFFVKEFPRLLSVDHIFPNALGRLLGLTVGNPVLWHSMLALSSSLADKIVGRTASRTFFHLQQALPLIQSAIQNMTISGSHIYAVFLLAYLSLCRGEIGSAGRHLDGLYLMLEHRAKTQTQEDPFVNAFRRLAIRMDNVRGFTGRTPVFPTHTLAPMKPHREWLSQLMEPDKLGALDWALAEFEMEDLANKMIHLNLRARMLRASPNYNPATDDQELMFRAEVLLNELHHWKMKPIFMATEADENLSRLASLGQDLTPTFLNYPPLPFKNVLYAGLLIMMYRLQILGSLIIHPELGANPPKRLEIAINLCRTYASYKALRHPIPSNMIMPLAYVGFVFSDKIHSRGSPSGILLTVEFEWTCEQLMNMDQQSGLAAASLTAQTLRTIWQTPTLPFWDIFFQKGET
jgi:hypothetical protein